ncbi:MAG: AAA family ATPase [Planctomycetes bacterium]|nr:AAA family ATPase [Planctomycetota bacterium]
MRFASLELTNLKCVGRATLDLDPAWNVLIGDNGSGKSTILRLLAIYLNRGLASQQYPESLMRAGMTTAEVFARLEGRLEDLPDVTGHQVSTMMAGGAKSAWFTMRETLAQGSETTLLSEYGFDSTRTSSRAGPLEPAEGAQATTPFVFVPSIRPAGLQTGRMEAKYVLPPRLVAVRSENYNRALNGTDSAAGPLSSVVAAYMRQVIDDKEGRSECLREFTAYQAAIRRLLPGYELLPFHTQVGHVMIRGPHAELPFHMLSDGEQAILALALRVAEGVLYSQPQPREEAFEAPAIVLIDELDAHLHPSWQRQVIPRLSSLLPNAQFIVATHSPLVLTGLVGLNRSYRVHRLVRAKDGVTCETVRSDTGAPLAKTISRIITDLFGVSDLPVKVMEVFGKLSALLAEIGDATPTAEQQRRIDEWEGQLETLSPPEQLPPMSGAGTP